MSQIDYKEIKMNFFSRPLINLTHQRYLLSVLIIAPALNFLFGINVDLYSASLPSIATYFNISEIIAKKTILSALLGFALGSIFFGAVIDYWNKRKVLILSLLLYIVVSFAAIYINHFKLLVLIRLLQGIAVASISISSRILIFQNFTGKEYLLGMLYTSLAYGLGPIISPFIGSYIEAHFGWRANFSLYFFIGMLMLLLVSLFIAQTSQNNTSQEGKNHQKIKLILRNYIRLLKDPVLLSGSILLGISLTQLLLYPTLAPFFIIDTEHKSVLFYGRTALLVGLGYLVGMLLNRFLLERFSVMKLISFGLWLIVVVSIIRLILSFYLVSDIFGFFIMFTVVNFSVGFVFSNVLALSLKHFPQNVGAATGLISFLFVLFSTIASGIVSRAGIETPVSIVVLFIVLALMQLLTLYGFFKNKVSC